VICLFIVAATNAKPTGSALTKEQQLYALKLDRAECEHLLTVHGKPQQYVIRESRKVQQPFAYHTDLNTSTTVKTAASVKILV